MPTGCSSCLAGVAERCGCGRRSSGARQKRSPAELNVEALDESGADPALRSEFQRAVDAVGSSLGGQLSNAAKLQLYGGYKQALVGDCPDQCPRGMEASMKWEAWRKNLGMPRAAAMQLYVDTLKTVVPGWAPDQAAEEVEQLLDAAPPDKEASGGMGQSVSTMLIMGDPDMKDVDDTAEGQLNEMVAAGDVDTVLRVGASNPRLLFLQDKDGMTPLHWAADRGSMAMVESILSHRGEGQLALDRINAQDDNGDTPLHYAVMSEHKEIAKLLLRHGADPALENEEGESAASLAGWAELVQDA